VRARRPDAVLVGYLGNFDVALVRALVRPTPVVLDFLIAGASTAVDRGERGAVKQRALRMLDEWALRHADMIMIDTEEQAQALPARHAGRAVVVAVGADDRWFAAGRDRAPTGSGRMSVVFYGLFTPLQGVAVIAAALRELDGLVDATLIGSGQDDPIAAPLLAGVPGVVRVPWIRPDELPSVVAEHDVCLGIFGSTAKAGRVVPNKVYQGAAAGCAIVTSDTPPQRRLLGDAALLVPPGDPGALAAALRRLATDPALRVAQASAARALAEDRFSAERVVEPLAAALERVL
jgi:glycosyltransferase involved in cell wall biosynthesis